LLAFTLIVTLPLCLMLIADFPYAIDAPLDEDADIRC